MRFADLVICNMACVPTSCDQVVTKDDTNPHNVSSWLTQAEKKESLVETTSDGILLWPEGKCWCGLLILGY